MIDALEPTPTPALTFKRMVGPVAQIKAIVSVVMNVTIPQIDGRNRCRTIVRARQAVGYLARTVHGLSYPAIGRAMGKDHTTIMHGEEIIRREIGRDEVFAAQIETMRHLVEEEMDRLRTRRLNRKITDAATLPLRITTTQVLDLAGISQPTLAKRIAAGDMPRSVDKGVEYLYDRDAVLKALGLLAAPVQEAVTW